MSGHSNGIEWMRMSSSSSSSSDCHCQYYEYEYEWRRWEWLIELLRHSQPVQSLVSLSSSHSFSSVQLTMVRWSPVKVKVKEEVLPRLLAVKYWPTLLLLLLLASFVMFALKDWLTNWEVKPKCDSLCRTLVSLYLPAFLLLFGLLFSFLVLLLYCCCTSF